MDKQNLEGIIPALFTPFKPDEKVDEESLSNLINYLIESGIHGLWVLGTSSEFSSLSIAERKRSYRFILDEVNNRIPCVAAVSSSSTKVCVDLAKYVEDVGYEAVAATPPYYLQSNSQSLARHYRTVSDSVDIPLAIYDNSGATHHVVSETFIAEMNRDFGINMVKVGGDPRKTPLAKCINLKGILGDDINIQVASAYFAYYAFTMGVADGTISALLNVIPEQFVKMYEAIKKGNIEIAREIHYKKVLPLGFLSFNLDTSETVAMCMGKTILKWRGIIKHETVRKPLGPLKSWEEKYLKEMAEYTSII